MEENKKINNQNTDTSNDSCSIDGKDIAKILDNRDWFQPIENGRRMDVGTISVAKGDGGRFVMQAHIDGSQATHEISSDDYNLFLQLDDANRLKLFDALFPEVKIKSADGKDSYNRMDGPTLAAIKKDIGFYYNVNQGREVDISEIRVDRKGGNTYCMSAVINGKEESVDISRKTYELFLAVDDSKRIRLFSKSFRRLKTVHRPKPGKENAKAEDEGAGKPSFVSWILALLGLCTIKEKMRLQKTIRKLEESNKETKAQHTSEMKRLKMNMSALRQQQEDMKEVAANWKQIKDKYDKYEEHFKAELEKILSKKK